MNLPIAILVVDIHSYLVTIFILTSHNSFILTLTFILNASYSFSLFFDTNVVPNCHRGGAVVVSVSRRARRLHP